MPNLLNRSKTLGTILSGLLSLTAYTEADVAFRYGNGDDYVAYDSDFARSAQTASSNPFVQICPFDADSPLLQTSESYTGPSFFGGYQLSSSLTSGAFSRQQIRERGEKGDAITLQSYSGDSWAGSELALSAIFLFKQANFLESFRSGDFHTEAFACKWSSYFKGESRDISGRYVVQIGTRYYLSSYTFNMTNSGSDMLPAGMIGSVLWAPYDPVASLNFDQAQANFSRVELNAVQAVGVYIEDDHWIGDDSVSSPYALSIYGFTASGSIQP